MDVKTFFDSATCTATHVVIDPVEKAAAIIDSVLDYDAASGRTSTASADAVLAFVEARGVTVCWILETHIHADHLSAAPYLKERLGGKTAVGAEVRNVQGVFRKIYNLTEELTPDGAQFDVLFKDGDRFKIGVLEAEVIATPGHTPACVAYRVEDAVFVGDTLFMPDFGSARCDFPGGDARQLYRSVQRLLSLPPETRLFLCHDYAPGGRDYVWETTVAEQRARNKHMRDGVSEEEFVAMREARDKELSMPALLLPAVQVNIRGGNLPKPEGNGVRYLKIPIDSV